MKFNELELHPSLSAAVQQLGFDECTPVQAATIPPILEGKDVAGLAQTGTGKTAAFLLPMMDRILSARPPADADEALKEKFAKRAFPDWRSNQFILVLVPTRELAEQVYENVRSLRGDSGLRVVSIYGGVAYDKQKQGLKDGVEFIIATPGRLLDLQKEHLVDLKNCRAIIFDEADRMFDMGFKDDMKFILQRVPKERQFLVFSATLNLDVLSTAYQFGANPVEVDVSRDQAKAENVEDKIFHVGHNDKPQHLLSLIRKYNPKQTIIFSNFKMNVANIARFLSENQLPAVGISSLLTQAQRTRVMEQFRAENDHNVLVATDVAARGLDIKGVDMVINYELPDDAENYVHRIGRTGRAGAKGLAYSFVSDRDVDALTRIEEYLRHKVEVEWMDDKELVTDFKPMQSDRPQRRGPPRGRTQGEGAPRNGGDRNRRPRNGSGPQQNSQERGPRVQPRRDQQAGQHRDKVSGRHRSPEQSTGATQGPAQASGNPNSQPRPVDPNWRSNRNRNNARPSERHASGKNEGNGRGPRPHSNSRPHKRPNPVHGQNAKGGPTRPPTSIGQKVSGFFKKLFGG